MTTARIIEALPSRSVLETAILFAGFLIVHGAAYCDREQDIDRNTEITLSLISKILATSHSVAAFLKIWEDLQAVELHAGKAGLQFASKATVAVSAGTLAGVWASTNSIANLACGLFNATTNFTGRICASSYRSAALQVDFNQVVHDNNSLNYQATP